MDPKTRPVARLRTISTPKQRRHQDRLPCTLDVSYRKLGSRSNYFWMARIWDISRTGISLQLKDEILKGTILEIEVLKGPNVARTLLARVAHATEHESNSWIIGCDLDQPLSEEELASLV